MHTHYFQHVPFEGLGCIEPWLKNQGHHLTATRFHESNELPELETVDFLIVMGGPMGVNDLDQFPWLKAEKQFIRDFIASGKPVLGICLGAQLIASSLGASITRNPDKEIGWWPIQSISNTPTTTFSFPESITVFHWHGDTFAIPEGAKRIAGNRACTNQAFQLGEKVIGLQFHLETTPSSLAGMLEHCHSDITPGTFVQAADQISRLGTDHIPANNEIMYQLLTYLTR